MIILTRRIMRDSAHKAETAYVDLDPFSSHNLGKDKHSKSEEKEEEALK
jgi:cytochrome d ubiquinol oxidase subunit I